MAPPRRALLTAPTGAAPQRLLATTVRVARLAGGRLAVRRCHRALQPAIGCGGDGRMAEPPAPALTGPGLAPSLPRQTARRARPAPPAGGQHPERQRARAVGEQGMGPGLDGALAALAPVPCTSRAVRLGAPGIAVVALAPGTWPRALLPPERMAGGVTRVDVAECVDVREHRHG
jgi:hypothetical protein